MPNEPRRHHYVQAAYLQRFSDNGQVAVRWRDRDDIFETGVKNVAVECGFYEVVAPDGTKSVAAEYVLNDIEGPAMQVLAAIDQDLKAPIRDSGARLVLATYMALQLSRTPEAMDRVLFPQYVMEYAKDRPIDEGLIAEYLTTVHLGFEPESTEVEAALDVVRIALREPALLTKQFAIDVMFRSIDQVGAALLQKSWSLEVARKPRLMTSDMPVVLWRRESERDEYEGVGVQNAEEIRLPLDTGKQLILSDKPEGMGATRVEPARVRDCNQAMADACHKFVVSHPGQRRELGELDLAQHRPVLRFNTGPLLESDANGSMVDKGRQVLHVWTPRRSTH